jgi:hypothetical protein
VRVANTFHDTGDERMDGLDARDHDRRIFSERGTG